MALAVTPRPALAVTRRPEFSDILRRDESFAVAYDQSLGNQFNGWFDRLMLQSGTDTSPAMMPALCLCSALTLGGLVFVLQENLLTTAVASFAGFALPVLVAMVIRSRRQSQMAKQMPAMIDELARAAKTGRSLENCLSLVANDTPHPLGGELRICTRKLTLGLNVDEALRELPERTGLIATSVLATALSVHRQSGGDLVLVLERLAVTLRDRLQFQGRLKAATAASRAVAVLMLALPPGILAFFAFNDPNYWTSMLESPWAMRAAGLAVVMQVIGAVWVIRILRKSQQL